MSWAKPKLNFGATENARLELSAPNCRGGKCGTKQLWKAKTPTCYGSHNMIYLIICQNLQCSVCFYISCVYVCLTFLLVFCSIILCVITMTCVSDCLGPSAYEMCVDLICFDIQCYGLQYVKQNTHISYGTYNTVNECILSCAGFVRCPTLITAPTVP